MNDSEFETMLDWPIEQQEQEAAREGLTLEAWQEKERAWLLKKHP